MAEQLTVRTLIEELQKIEDKDLPVLSDGCDCFGPAVAVEIFEGSAIISRK